MITTGGTKVNSWTIEGMAMVMSSLAMAIHTVDNTLKAKLMVRESILGIHSIIFTKASGTKATSKDMVSGKARMSI